MTALLAAQTAAVLHHIFIDVLVADLGFGIVDAKLVKGFVETEVRHNGGDNGVAQQLATLLHVLAVNIENVVAGDHIAFFIHTQAPVGIAVIGKAHIQTVIQHKPAKDIDMGGTGIGVDVVTVGIGIDDIGFGAQRVKNRFCHIPAGTVGAVQTHLHTLERVHTQRDQITDVAVTAGDIVHRPSDLIPLGQGKFLPGLSEGFHRPVEIGFDQSNDALIHLLTEGIDQLDAIVVIRIVAGGDHDTAVKAVGPRHISNGGGGGDVQQIGIRSGSHQTADQRVFKHIAGAAGILTDDDPGRTVSTAAALQLGVVPAEETADFERMVGSQCDVGFSSEAVSSKIFSHRITPCRIF